MAHHVDRGFATNPVATWRIADDARPAGRAISIRMAQCPIIGMAGTSPAMTKWELPQVLPLLRILPAQKSGLFATGMP